MEVFYSQKRPDGRCAAALRLCSLCLGEARDSAATRDAQFTIRPIVATVGWLPRFQPSTKENDEMSCGLPASRSIPFPFGFLLGPKHRKQGVRMDGGAERVVYVTATKAEVHSAMACNYRRSRSYAHRAWWSTSSPRRQGAAGQSPFSGRGSGRACGERPLFRLTLVPGLSLAHSHVFLHATAVSAIGRGWQLRNFGLGLASASPHESMRRERPRPSCPCCRRFFRRADWTSGWGSWSGEPR